jgi:hypothetical protein
MLKHLWQDMDQGGFSVALARQILKFNGKLFKDASADSYTLPLKRAQIDQLLQASSSFQELRRFEVSLGSDPYEWNLALD